MAGPLEDNPRTVTAITQEALETTGTTSVRELARSTPGISLGFGEGGNSFGDNIYIRGFKANNDTYTDGSLAIVGALLMPLAMGPVHGQARVVILDTKSANAAMADPHWLDNTPKTVTKQIECGPYAVAFAFFET